MRSPSGTGSLLQRGTRRSDSCPHLKCMIAQEYLLSKLKNCTDYRLPEEDSNYLGRFGVEKFIYKKITSKKFRKWSIDDSVKKRITEAIRNNVSKHQPIQFTFPFGGYKLWRYPSSPKVDWAEFFSVSYYCEFVAPILKVYDPGAIFFFASDDIVVELMDNIPKADTEEHLRSFEVLLSSFRKYFPSNFKMELKKIGDLYGNEFDDEIKKLFNKTSGESNGWDLEKKEKLLKTSALNFKMDGAINFSNLSPGEKNEKIRVGAVYHEAYRHMIQKIIFVYPPDRIVLSARPTIDAVPIGSSRTSSAKFWTGFGVLEYYEGRFVRRVLSFEQWNHIKENQHDLVSSGLEELAKNNKNYRDIDIYNYKLNFAHQSVQIP